MTRLVVIAGYLVILGAMIALEAYSRSRPDRVAPLDEMLTEVMTSRIVRVGIIAGWWWFGWHFFFAPTV
ncbi:DUF6186 family protein [Lacisediminihabitans sp.]|uniref:DUF6186 family protein n=1 Tax=Lacisediminihabitans sp. TaxID=2787631 RepID=UPI002F94FCAA